MVRMAGLCASGLVVRYQQRVDSNQDDAPVWGGCPECYYTKLKLLGGLAMSSWEQLILEPRWLTMSGLGLDFIGGRWLSCMAA